MINNYNTTIIIPSKNFNDPYILIEKTGLLKIYKSINLIFVFYESCKFSNFLDYSKISIIENSNGGIYDSYNKAIKQVGTEYYIIIGDDDKLIDEVVFLNVLSNVNLAIYDVYILGILKNNKAVIGFYPENIGKYIFGSFPSHSGGMIVRVNLHEKYGYYNLKYMRLADQLFFNTLFINNVRILDIKAIAFSIGSEGYSSDYFATLRELYRMNLDYKFVNKKVLFFRFIILYSLRGVKKIKDTIF